MTHIVGCRMLNVTCHIVGCRVAVATGKGYIDMSTVDEQTSTRIGEAVAAKGGRFLEVGGGRMGGRG